MFATKPKLARCMISRALDAGVPAAWITGDEVYGADPGLRTDLERRGNGYVLAVAASHRVSTAAGTCPVRQLAARLPRRAWQRYSAGEGAKGHRYYDWAWLATDPGQPGCRHLLIRRNRHTREVAFYRCYSPCHVSLPALVKTAGTRWTTEMVFPQLAKGPVWAVGGGWEYVADLDFAVCDDDAVDEQLSQLPPLREGGGGQPGADRLAECLDPVSDGGEFQPLLGGGVQLVLLGQQGGMPAV